MESMGYDMSVVGVDSCPRGWITVALDASRSDLQPRFFDRFEQILSEFSSAEVIAVDIPIGLTDGKPRACDIEARKRLGWPGMASVFPAPARSLIHHTDYREAKAESRARFGHAVTRQSFALFRKVREVDEALAPELQSRVFEVHPELSFWAMNDRSAMAFGKKTQAGIEDRLAVIAERFSGFELPTSRAEAKAMAPLAGVDDFLDAIAAAWTAQRIADGKAEFLPGTIEADERGLRMQIAL
jgi:predicted RNase H-like nuclease